MTWKTFGITVIVAGVAWVGYRQYGAWKYKQSWKNAAA